jgi:hypothetical protein
MSNNGQYAPKVTPNEFSAMGWEDYLADPDKPFRKEYFEWNEVQQRHYERGRLRASGAPIVYAKVPKKEPANIVQKTNGLRLVPPARKKRRRPVRPLRPREHDLR